MLGRTLVLVVAMSACSRDAEPKANNAVANGSAVQDKEPPECFHAMQPLTAEAAADNERFDQLQPTIRALCAAKKGFAEIRAKLQAQCPGNFEQWLDNECAAGRLLKGYWVSCNAYFSTRPDRYTGDICLVHHP
jgi:hypothetical protein